MKPPTCNNSEHKNCTLYSCFNKCYNSIVPNGACGYILEYVINERHKLPVESRDDLYVNVYSKDFLSNFYNHVSRVIYDTNWDIENSLKYKYEGMFNWYNENRRSNNFYLCQPMLHLDFWFGQESWKELKYQKEFIIFVDPMDTSPYISEKYLICDYDTSTCHNIRKVENLFGDPNFAILSDKHYYLASSNKSLVPELQEGIIQLCRNYKVIFEIKPDTICDCKNDFRKLFESFTFSRFGKKDDATMRSRSYHLLGEEAIII